METPLFVMIYFSTYFTNLQKFFVKTIYFWWWFCYNTYCYKIIK